MFFIIIRTLHVSGGLSARHTAGVDGLESGREQESMTLPKAAHTVL